MRTTFSTFKKNLSKFFLGLEVTLFFCFCFLLSFGSLKIFSFGGTYYIYDFYIHIIGFVLLCCSFWDERIFKHRDFVGILLVLSILMMLLSLAAAAILYPYTNGYYGTNPFAVVLYESFKYFHFVTIVFYVFAFESLLNKKELFVIFAVNCFLVLVVGLAQLAISLTKNPALSNLYDKLNFLGFASSSLLEKSGYRIYGTFTEPSNMDMFFCCFFFPMVMAYLFEKKKKIPILLGLFVLLAIFGTLAFFTKSTSVYVGIIADVVAFCVLLIKSQKGKKYKLICSYVIFLLVLFSVLALQTTSFGRTFFSVVIDKIFSGKNDSTNFRFSSTYNDLVILAHSPIFGCGNGMQGYFYFGNVVGTNYSYATESLLALSGKLGLIYGGAFIPSFLSSFGLVGVFLFVPILKSFTRQLTVLKHNDSYFYRFMLLSLPAMFVTLTASENIIMNYQLVFLIGIPFIDFKNPVGIFEKLGLKKKSAIDL